MPKKIQDISSSKKRSIRDIEKNTNATRIQKSASETPQHLNGSNRHYKSKKRAGVAMWITIIVVIIFLFFVLSAIFSGSRVEIQPRTQAVNIDHEFTAFRDASGTDLQYETMTLTTEDFREVPATGTETLEQRASGRITVYNNFGPEPQQLIATTRFETPNGLIYRIQEPIVVPGTREVDGATVPGSVSAQVLADEPGERYNIGMTEFTIPGLEGDPRFDGFHAESETTMTGGFSGEVSTVSEEDKAEAEEGLMDALRSELIAEARSQLPDGYVLFENGSTFTYTSLPSTEGSQGMARVRLQGTLEAVIVEESKLAGQVARELVGSYDGAPVRFGNLDDVSISIATEGDNATSSSGITFDLNGSTDIVWVVDVAQIRSDLAGESKGDIDAILAGYPSIESAEIVMKPFWKRTFPEDVSEIDIAVSYPGSETGDGAE